MTGQRWSRPDDHFGVGVVVNRASSAAEHFFNAGGLGILVGDGQLPHPGSERLVETYYSFRSLGAYGFRWITQFIVSPAYNRDRGPVSVFGCACMPDLSAPVATMREAGQGRGMPVTPASREADPSPRPDLRMP